MNFSEAIQQIRKARDAGDKAATESLFETAVSECKSNDDFERLLWWVDGSLITEETLGNGLQRINFKNIHILKSALGHISNPVILHNLLIKALEETNASDTHLELFQIIKNKSEFKASSRKLLLKILDALRREPNKKTCLGLIEGLLESNDHETALDTLKEFNKYLISPADGHSKYIDIILKLDAFVPEKTDFFIKNLLDAPSEISISDLHRLLSFSRKKHDKKQDKLLEKILQAILENAEKTIKNYEEDAVEWEKIPLETLCLAGRLLKALGNNKSAEKCRDIALLVHELDRPNLRLIYDTFFGPQYNWDEMLSSDCITSYLGDEGVGCSCCVCDSFLEILPESMSDLCCSNTHNYFYLEGDMSFSDTDDEDGHPTEKLMLDINGELNVSETPKPKTIYLDAIYCPDCYSHISNLLGDDSMLGPYYFDDEDIIYKPSGGNSPRLKFVVEPVREIYLPGYTHDHYSVLEENIEAKSLRALSESGRL